MSSTPDWRIAGDWFDNCSCAVACPCTFAQAPDNNFCEHVLFWHIREGHFGEVELNGLCVVQVGSFEGNLWDADSRGRAGLIIDDRASDLQADASSWPLEGRPVLNGLGDVRRREVAGPSEVRDGSRHPQDPVIGASAKAKPLHR